MRGYRCTTKTWGTLLQEAIAVVGQQRIVTKLSGNIHEEYSTNWLYCAVQSKLKN